MKNNPNIGDVVAIHNCKSYGISKTVDTVYGILLKKPNKGLYGKFTSTNIINSAINFKFVIYVRPQDRNHILVCNVKGLDNIWNETQKFAKIYYRKNSVQCNAFLTYPSSLTKAIISKKIVTLPMSALKDIETFSRLNKSEQEILPGDDVFILKNQMGQWNASWRCIRKYEKDGKEKYLIENIDENTPLTYDKKIFLLNKTSLIRISRRTINSVDSVSSKPKMRRRLIGMLDN